MFELSSRTVVICFNTEYEIKANKQELNGLCNMRSLKFLGFVDTEKHAMAQGNTRARLIFGLQKSGEWEGARDGLIHFFPCLPVFWVDFADHSRDLTVAGDGRDREVSGGANECFFVSCVASEGTAPPNRVPPSPSAGVYNLARALYSPHNLGSRDFLLLFFFTRSENTHTTFNKTSVFGTAWFSAFLQCVLAFYFNMFWERMQLGERVFQ